MTEKLREELGDYKIWKNPSRRGEPVAYLGPVSPAQWAHFFFPQGSPGVGFRSRRLHRDGSRRIFSFEAIFEMANGQGPKMIDVRKAEAQASPVGYLPARLDGVAASRSSGMLTVLGTPIVDDRSDEEWRGRVAQSSHRRTNCSPKPSDIWSVRDTLIFTNARARKKHELFAPIYCDLRFCPRCAPRQFARLIQKYEPVLKAISALKNAGIPNSRNHTNYSQYRQSDSRANQGI